MNTITLRLARSEIIWLRLLEIPRHPGNWLMFAFVFAIGTIFSLDGQSFTYAIFAGLARAAAIMAFAAAVYLILVASSMGQTAGVLGSLHFCIVDEGLRTWSDAYDCLYKWAYIRLVIQFKSHLLVCLGDGSCHIVPRRAFESDEAFNAFHQKLESGAKEHARPSTPTSAG